MILHADPFDHYVSADIARWWSNVSGSPTITSGGRNSTNKLQLGTANAAVAQTIATPATSGGAAFAFQPETRVTTNNAFFSVRTGTTVHFDLHFNGSGQIIVRDGAGTTLATGASVISTASFTHVEVKWTIGNAGSVEIRLNGSGSNDLTASGVDVQNGATGTWDNALLQGKDGALNGNTTNWDDWVLWDENDSGVTGNACNDWLGDVRAMVVLPSTGNGTHTDFTTSTGADHGALVDETTPNDDTDYVGSSTVGHVDTYNYPALSITPAFIYAVIPAPCVKKTDAGGRSICAVTRSGSTDYDGTTRALSTSYLFYPEILHADPDTGDAWDLSGVNGAEFGLKVVA